MPFVSVIIPVFNKERFVANTLKSVLAQTFQDYEILIVDDGSTDKSAEIIRRFDDKRIQLFSEHNRGVSGARNFGISQASGKFIAFLDADDIWNSDFLQTLISNIQKFPEQRVFSSAIEIEANGRTFPAKYSIKKREDVVIVDYFEASLLQSVIFTSAAIFEKSIFEKTGGFDETLRTEEDLDLWIRIGLEYKVVFCWKIGVRYVHDNFGLSHNLKNIERKTDFSHYSEIARTNLKLQKFLDNHRYSIALKSKIAGNREGFQKFSKGTNKKNLNFKQRILLSLPSFLIRKLFSLKLFLQQKNIQVSAFK